MALVVTCYDAPTGSGRKEIWLRPQNSRIIQNELFKQISEGWENKQELWGLVWPARAMEQVWWKVGIGGILQDLALRFQAPGSLAQDRQNQTQYLEGPLMLRIAQMFFTGT